MPWNSDMEKSTLARALPDGSANEELPLKLGVFWTDGVVGPQPPIERGLRIVHDVLKSMGHKIMLNKFTYVLLSIVDALYNKSDPF